MGGVTPIDTPEVVVEPAQAPAVFAEVLRVLKGQPTEQELHQALVDLDAACMARFQEACDFLHEKSERPDRLQGELPSYPQAALMRQRPGHSAWGCLLGSRPSQGVCLVPARGIGWEPEAVRA